MSFNDYLIENIQEGAMSDMHVELQEEIAKLIPEFIEDGELNTPGLAFQLMDQYKVAGQDLEKLIDMEGLVDLIGLVYEQMQKGEI